MKIRSGFVSNSSSASFVVKWRISDIDHLTVEEALEDILPWTSSELFKKIESNTVKDKDPSCRNTFTSSFFTTMMNSHADFDDSALLLWFALSVSPEKDVDILYSNIEGDY